MSALEILDQVPEFAQCLAREIQRLMEPHKDEITQNEAYRRYGRGWIDRYAEMNLLHPQYHGTKKKMYSISEIERVKAKENVAARLKMK